MTQVEQGLLVLNRSSTNIKKLRHIYRPTLRKTQGFPSSTTRRLPRYAGIVMKWSDWGTRFSAV